MASESDFDGLTISSVTGAGLRELVGRLGELVREARQLEAEAGETTIVIHRPVSETVDVDRIADNEYVVHGRQALRAVRLSDLTDPDALAHAQNRLESIGVHRALRKAGAREGDIVHIGDLSFEYEEDV